ncbi:hypothetical protein [Ruegeria arenilitoris]|uniref:hypothetical protein n=1 Tax=Ruegeria arenilitoris TaxID=1173585 RepID=UPI00147D2464|nr:hypothetical protein [Ruegeria arenilitoris]
MARKRQKPLKAKIPPDHPFSDIISDAYRLFAYTKPTNIEVCEGCCMEADIEADFFIPSISELPLHYLQDWFFAAYDPKGISKATWGYLLPRILEVLAVDEDLASVGLEVSLNRFETGNPNNWSHDEWQVLDRFQRAYLKREIERDNCYLDDTVCMFGLAGWPVETLFEQVAETPDAVLVQRFWHDWCASCIPGRESVWITAFWESPGNSKAFAFYTSKALYDRVTRVAFGENTPKDLSEKALAVASVIENNVDWTTEQ